MKIRMLTTVRPDISFLSAWPVSVLREGETYEAVKNRNGAITGICDNGNTLGVKPGEFEIVEEG